MEDLVKMLLGFEKVIVMENTRAVLLENGRVADILKPGLHWIRRKNTDVESHNLSRAEFVSSYERALFLGQPGLAAEHLTLIETGEDEVAVVLRDGRIHDVMAPQMRAVLWTDAGPWAVERVDVSETLEVDARMAVRLARAGQTARMASFEVPEAHVGLMTLEGAFDRVLEAGTHRFWAVARKIAVKLVDLRRRVHDVTGQEILTKDRVTIRVNLAAEFRVVDPVKATTAVKDFEEALHRALQFAFRKTLGALTLDALLAEKVSVDAEAAALVRAQMAEIGLEVGEIALKDVILPGEMREILNQVVAAQKEAEANVIRRREETNATRSLLNTAKVMEENPVMLRLKELEALEGIAAKVDQLTIHNGTDGLMKDLVRLRD
ncbi:MAG: SPFH domain-containing protein [Pseudomonadota bacterium]